MKAATVRRRRGAKTPGQGKARGSVAASYARQVYGGRLVACRYVKLAAQRHLEDLERSDIFYDVREEKRFLQFCGYMRHVQGLARGQRFEPAPFQVFLAGSLLCWKVKETGLRRFRTGFIEMARKNAKTWLAAAVIAWVMIQRSSESAELYSAATTRDQASRVYEYLEKILRGSAVMRREFFHKYNRLWSRRRGSFLRSLAADSHKLDGLMPLVVLADEVHAWKGRMLRDVLLDSFGGTPEGLMLYITTSGFNMESVWWEEREDAIKILEGEAEDDTAFAYIATIDEGDEEKWDTEKVWRKANPGLGVTKSVEYQAAQVRRVRRQPRRKATFLVKDLNYPQHGELRWMSPKLLADNRTGEVDEEALAGQVCWTGVDLASTNDIAGFLHVFPPDGHGGRYEVLPRFFMPAVNIHKKAEEDQARYQQWAEEGWLTLTRGSVIDVEILEAQFMEDAQRFAIEGVGFDPWNATDLAMRLQKGGVGGIQKFRQGRALSWCFLELDRLVAKGRLNTGGHPVLEWMLSNAVCNEWQGMQWIDRDLSKGKIDGAVMLTMAVGRMLSVNKSEKAGSRYDRHELEEMWE